jgi:hypothetical protein
MSGHQPYEKLRAKMSPRRRVRNAAASKKMLVKLLIKDIREILEQLPAERACEVLDFARFLAHVQQEDEWQAAGKREFARAYGPEEPEYSERDILGAGH